MGSEAVKVVVRARPLNERERLLKCDNILEVFSDTGQCSIISPNDKKRPPKIFFFDGSYDQNSTTEQIYNDVCYPLVEGVTEGYNGTIFAYGQTGCGKSYTMQGVYEPPFQKGVIPRAFDQIFETMSVSEKTKYLVHASFLEIYNEEVRDLLGHDYRAKLELKENPDKGVYVAGLSMHKITSVAECQNIMERGWKNRSTGATLMNADSSRSHSIFTIYLEMIDGSDNLLDYNHIRAGKLNLVDLAGSERQTKTGATGDRFKEATKINLSLSALGNVISALVDSKVKHIPYRDSKLTRLLQDYELKLQSMKAQYSAETDDKAKMLKDITHLKELYDAELMQLNSYQNLQPSTNQHLDQTEELIEISDDKIQQQIVTKNDTNVRIDTYDEEVTKDELLKRLKLLEADIVGGEQAGNKEVNEKISRRKTYAEERKRRLVEANANLEDDGIMINIYETIQDELYYKNKALQSQKQKVYALQMEIKDVQSEFEQDRSDYLETIRRQEQQINLLNMILEKVQPCIRRDSNYYNIDKIKRTAIFDAEKNEWILPQMVIEHTQLPSVNSDNSSNRYDSNYGTTDGNAEYNAIKDLKWANKKNLDCTLDKMIGYKVIISQADVQIKYYVMQQDLNLKDMDPAIIRLDWIISLVN
ncbi:unnamed protein product [Schistosoma mattheei]|uniref:Kinesin-like protein n=2 Tax=Schistosoma mattheei TaxID=31246 RepID=A0AA85BWW4_9TREM|nr:unnamed protein product [Schistosoma mattheei]